MILFVSFLNMSKTYRHISTIPEEDEEEPLTAGSDVADEKLAWRAPKRSIVDRLERISPHWTWFAHAILLSISMTFFALSFCVKSAKHGGGRLPDTYCRFFKGQNHSKMKDSPKCIAPALSSIKYEIQHFDLPPVAEGPFIGKGPEVDAMWEYITDGSKSILFDVRNAL